MGVDRRSDLGVQPLNHGIAATHHFKCHMGMDTFDSRSGPADPAAWPRSPIVLWNEIIPEPPVAIMSLGKLGLVDAGTSLGDHATGFKLGDLMVQLGIYQPKKRRHWFDIGNNGPTSDDRGLPGKRTPPRHHGKKTDRLAT